MRRLLDSLPRGRPPGAAALALFLLLCAVYAFSIDIRASRGARITGDEPFYLITTQSLLRDGDLDLANQYAQRSYAEFFDHPAGLWQQSLPAADGRVLSPHDPGLSVYLMPGFALGGLRGAQVQLLITAAATFALGYVLAARITGLRLLSWLACLGIGLSASAFIYATEIYPEVPAALLLVGALLILTLPGRAGLVPALLLAVLLSAMVWLGVKYIPLAFLVAGVFLWRATCQGRVALAAAGVISGAAFVWSHLAVYGGLTPYHVNLIYAGDSTVELVNQHFSLTERAYRLWGLFIDHRFGIGRWAPLLLLVPIALIPALRRGTLSRLIAALIAVQIGIATFLAITMMGWWFPGRTLITVFPLFALPLVLLLRDAPGWFRPGALALGIYGVAVTASLAYAGHTREVVIAVDPFALSAPLFQAVGTLFPDYRHWTGQTYALTVAWLALGLGGAAWQARLGSVFPRRRAAAGTATVRLA